jgi:hypothetical protein
MQKKYYVTSVRGSRSGKEKITGAKATIRVVQKIAVNEETAELMKGGSFLLLPASQFAVSPS